MKHLVNQVVHDLLSHHGLLAVLAVLVNRLVQLDHHAPVSQTRETKSYRAPRELGLKPPRMVAPNGECSVYMRRIVGVSEEISGCVSGTWIHILNPKYNLARGIIEKNLEYQYLSK